MIGVDLPDRTGYGRLVQDGHYAHAPSGLWGKYDNVRRIWEDQITRFAIRPALERLRRQARDEGRGLRVVDLGCGAGEGLDLLLQVPAGGDRAWGRYLLNEQDLAAYHGIDLCPNMIEQASRRCAGKPQLSFAVGDLAELGSFLAGHPSFDLYYNSYGSLSHLDDTQLRTMVADVVDHAYGPCVLLIDVHGQFSAEWPCYWNYSRDPAAARMQPYNMVWMYPASEWPDRLQQQRDYRVRYWRGEELRRFLLAVPGVAERQHALTLVDRSVLVGRHVDTGIFHPGVKPLRRAVNAMFEFNQRSDAIDLEADRLTATGDAEADGFFVDFVSAWNVLVHWFDDLGAGRQPIRAADLCAAGGPIPLALLTGMEALAEQARRLAWFDPGDPEANLLQPQFGLLLRQLEFHAQRGLGCGHGLLAVLELGSASGRR